MGKRAQANKAAEAASRRRPTLQLGDFGRRRYEHEGNQSVPGEDLPTAQEESSSTCLWKEVVEEASGDMYYWNMNTGETTWERPAELGPPPGATEQHPDATDAMEIETSARAADADASGAENGAQERMADEGTQQQSQIGDTAASSVASATGSAVDENDDGEQ